MSKSHKTRVQVVRETTTLSFYDIVRRIVGIQKDYECRRREGQSMPPQPSTVHTLWCPMAGPSMQASLWIHTVHGATCTWSTVPVESFVAAADIIILLFNFSPSLSNALQMLAFHDF